MLSMQPITERLSYASYRQDAMARQEISDACMKVWHLTDDISDDRARLGLSWWNMGDDAKSTRIQCAHLLKKVSSDSPVAAALLARSMEWKAVQANSKIWITQYGQFPSVMTALGDRLTQNGQFPQAIICYQKGLDVVADASLAMRLANCYLAMGNEDQWLKTLEGAMTMEDYALTNAWINQTIAQHFMDKNDARRALAYADAAAQSGAEFALQCAMAAHEGVGDWDGAEQMAKQITQRYGYADWFGVAFAHGARRRGRGSPRGPNVGPRS